MSTRGGARKGAGRKPVNRDLKQVSVRIDRILAEKLAKYCDREKISVAKWIAERIEGL